jgi:hypothetical protein
VEGKDAGPAERSQSLRPLLGSDGPVQPKNFGHVALWVWRYYQQRRRGIERDFAGRWRDGAVLLDAGVQAAMHGEMKRLRQEMRALLKTHGGVYPVPIYD